MPQQGYSYEDLIAIQNIVRDTARDSLSAYFTCSTAERKSDGSIVTDADMAMQQALTETLGERYPAIGMLGEEVDEAQQRAILADSGDYWCLDPVDGTTNFHATVPLFSVSLGLISEGRVVLGVIYDPNRDESFAALRGQGLWVDGERIERPSQPDRLHDCIAFIDFKRLDPRLSASLVGDTPYKSQRNIGTCALEWAWLAAGRVNLLLHGRERIWDYAAGSLLAEESGGQAETIEAETIFTQSLKPRSVVAASTPELFSQWAARVRSSL